MSTYTADDVLFGYRFNNLAFTVPTPEITDTSQDPSVTGRFFSGNTFRDVDGVNEMKIGITFRIFSLQTQKLTIGWGDGTFSEKNLSVANNDIARNEHEYTDGLDEHTVVFTFEKPKQIESINTVNVNVGEIIPEDIKKFTSLRSLIFRVESGIKSFPEDLSSLNLLDTLQIENAELPKIDSSLFSLPLKNLSFLGSIDFSTSEALESLSRLPEFVFLESLNFTSTSLTEFPLSFINRNLLKELFIGGDNSFTTLPQNIPTSLENLELTNKSPKLTSYVNFDRLVNLISVDFTNTFDNQNLLIGDEISFLHKLKKVTHKATNTQIQTDSVINNWFNFIVTRVFASIEEGSGNDKFRDMNFFLIQTANLFNLPSGNYQAPNGFQKNVSNGTPANELEKIYCLVENYGHTWEVGDGVTNGGTQTFSPS